MDTLEIMTVQQVAEYLHLHENTVYNMLHHNPPWLPGVKIGGKWYFRRLDIDAMLSKGGLADASNHAS